MYVLGQKAVEQKEKDSVAARHTGRSSCGNRFSGWYCCTSHGDRYSSLGWQKGEAPDGDFFVRNNGVLTVDFYTSFVMLFRITENYQESFTFAYVAQNRYCTINVLCHSWCEREPPSPRTTPVSLGSLEFMLIFLHSHTLVNCRCLNHVFVATYFRYTPNMNILTNTSEISS